MSSQFNEDIVEQAALDYFREIGYTTGYGPDLAPGGAASERGSYKDIYLFNRLRAAAFRINPDHEDLVDEAIKRVVRPESQDTEVENLRVHNLLAHGVPVEHRAVDGSLRTVQIKLLDFTNPEKNDWLVVNQFTIQENANRRPDVLVFVNGIPLGLIELKSALDEGATLRVAWNKIQNYRHDIPSIFAPNAVTVISDGTTAAMSSYSGGFDHFAPWKAIDSAEIAPCHPAVEVLIKGVFEPARFLDTVKNFITFSKERGTIVKKVAKYHQYWAVNKAIETTVEAAREGGDRRGGVVWHTQGSGKSLEMVFYAGKIMRDSRMKNPTLVFITDRNDLDDQLYEGTFLPASVLPETPVRAENREDLRDKLRRASGGIIFTTLHKFAPAEGKESNSVLTDRSNVIVVADEAHRSQYGLKETQTKDGKIRKGLALHMRETLPNATFLGFTGTPISEEDKSTRAVFGDYLDVYDLTRAVEDGATVKLYYEARLVRVSVDDDEHETINDLVDELTENAAESESEKARSEWSGLAAIVGAEKRLEKVAEDLVTHWEDRRSGMVGKAMIVTMKREIAVNLYNEISDLRPDWHHEDLEKGKIKIVMTGSTDDPAEFQPHLYTKEQRKKLASRAKDPNDELELVIVVDMWLTGFDAPVMNTMYIDKPMQGANLMQAIARVNRKFRDKPGGLIVDYIGTLANLRRALSEYSPSDQRQVGVNVNDVVDAMHEKYHVVTSMLHGTTYNSSPDLSPSERLAQHSNLVNFVMADQDLTKRYLDQVLALTKAHAMCSSTSEAQAINNDIRLFSGVRTAILKIQNPQSGAGGGGTEDIGTAIRQLVNEAVVGDDILDVYSLAGVEKPELSALTDEFLDSLVHKEKLNLQLGLLRRILNDEIKTIQRSNVVQGRKFSEMLDEAINKYTNRSLTTAEIIAELVEVAKEMRDNQNRHDDLGLSHAEAAFYDAIVQNNSAVLELGDDRLKMISIDLVRVVQNSVTIDWKHKESARATMRSSVRRLLAIHGYPPDEEDEAVKLVLEQATTYTGNGTRK